MHTSQLLCLPELGWERNLAKEGLNHKISLSQAQWERRLGMLEVWEPPGWSPRRKARCPGTSEPGIPESAAPLPPPCCPPARPAARANTSRARSSRSEKARGHPPPPSQALRSAPYRTPGPCQVVQQAERPRRYSRRCSALAPPCQPPASSWQPAPAPARSAGDPPHTRRGSGERGAGRCRADRQARGPMGGSELARGVAQAWFRPRLGSSRRHLPAPSSWVLTVLRPHASAHVRPRRREDGRASGEQGCNRLHGIAQGGLSRSPARSAGRSREKTLCAGAALGRRVPISQSSRQEKIMVWVLVDRRWRKEEADDAGE